MHRSPPSIHSLLTQRLRAAMAVALLAGAWSLPLEAQTVAADAAPTPGVRAGKPSGNAAPASGNAATAPGASPRPASAAPAGPQWSTLSAEHRVALAPLAPHWNGLSEGHKRKWMAMTRGFVDLSPDEQARMHDRMADWAALSPRQRAEARFNFASAQERLSPDGRKERWESYQALSSDEKNRLAAAAPPGAAKGVATPAHVPSAAPMPVRLVAPPADAVRAQASPGDPARQRDRIQHNTLLPERAMPGTPARAPRAVNAP
jgi:hypothetical protein